MFLYNDPQLKQRRKELRRKETPEEKLLWCNLRGKKLGYKFVRQYSVGPYIVDFHCVEKKIAIELDGLQHLQNKVYDKERDFYLQFCGVKVLRFWNAEISDSMDVVLNKITRELETSPHPM